MALVQSNQFGAVYEFGISDAKAPVIGGMKVRRAEITYQPGVTEKAMEGEGHVESVTTSKPEKRDWVGKFSGYIFDLNAFQVATANFSWRGRFWIIDSSTEPRQSGKYVECDVNATSYALVNTGPA